MIDSTRRSVVQGKSAVSFVLILLFGLMIGQNSARAQSFLESLNPFKGIRDSFKEIETQIRTVGNYAKAFGQLRLADEIGPADEFFIGREAAGAVDWWKGVVSDEIRTRYVLTSGRLDLGAGVLCPVPI